MKTNFAENFRTLRSALMVLALLLAVLGPTALTAMADSDRNSCDMFGTAATFGAGTTPVSVAVGDFDADGKPDLAVVNFDSSNVSVLLGNGDGTFQAAVNYASGEVAIDASRSLAVGDFNGDGNPDLAVMNGPSNSVSVLLGNGDGTFQAAVNSAAGDYYGHPISGAVGDFNTDGKLDLAVLANRFRPMSVLLGNGDGTFQATVLDWVGFGDVSDVAAGDFNADGKLDLAASSMNARTVPVLLGNGDGTFQAAVYSPADSAASDVEVGDLNADGKLDLAVASLGGPPLSVLLGNGDGTFQAAVSYAVGPAESDVSLGDLNADGKPDLVVANFSPYESNVSVLLGNGDGRFQAAVNYAYPVGAQPTSVAVGDFNSDGTLDLTTANSGSNNVSVLLGNTCNSPPVANAGIDQTVVYAGTAGTAVTLDGSASRDPDADLLTYTWTGPFTEGGGTTMGVSPTVTLPFGESTIMLVVNDGAVDSPPDTVRVLVKYGFSPGAAQLWLGLKNSDDVGTKFDLLAEVLKNGTLVGSGQLNNVAGGSSGFNNAALRTINLSLSSPVNVSAGDTLSIRLLVRIAVGVTGHRSGTARLWFNDAAANSRFGATIEGTTSDYFLLNGFAFGTAAGPGPKKTIDMFVDRAVGGNPFKPFGIWSKTF